MEGRKGSRIEERDKLSFDAVFVETSVDHMGVLKLG